MSDNRAIVYEENGRWIFRASSIGKSVRCLTSAMQGYDPLAPPEYLMKAAHAGTRMEADVKDRLRNAGWTITGEQHVLELQVCDDPVLIIRGHTDGWHCFHADDPDTDFVLEVKTMSKNVYPKWLKYGFERQPEYAAQISTYMHGAGRPALYAIQNRDNLEQHLETPIMTPPVPFAQIKAKLILAHYYYRKGTLPKCDSTSQYQCAYNYLCDKGPAILDEVESGTDEILAHLVEEYDRLRSLGTDLESRKNEIKNNILTALGDRDLATVGSWTVKNKEAVRRTLDAQKVAEIVGDRLDECYTDKPYKTLTITGKG